jgi:hypothetical protein
MPTHPVGREGQQDAVRLKNLVTAAENQLIARGMRGVEAREFLGPMLKLPHDGAIWGKRQHGLAIFRSEGVLFNYWLATPLDEAVIVGQRFHVKRLLPAISASQQFYILAVSRNRVRLLKATWHGIENLHPPGLPANIKEGLNLQIADRGEQVHSAMRGDLGKEAGVFHGQGGHRDTLKEELVEYFRLIAESVRPVLRETPLPLILAGVEYELALFRKVSEYTHIADEMLRGSFDYVEDHTLYTQASQLAQRYYDTERQQALAKYNALADTSLASDDIKTIVPAAHQGRIDTLFADHRAEEFGRYCPEGNCIEMTSQRDPTLDLVDLSIAQTIRHNGTVYAAAPGELPSAGPLRAIFRY